MCSRTDSIEVVDGVVQAAKKIKVGPGMEPDTEMGPLVSREQFERVTGYLAKGEEAGNRAVTGGHASKARATLWNPPCWWTPNPMTSSSARRSSGP